MNVLTDEEIDMAIDAGCLLPSEYKFARAIEAAVLAKIVDKLKDSDRYRWLIEQHWVQSEVDWRLIPTWRESTIEQLGEAIDAAMEGKAK